MVRRVQTLTAALTPSRFHHECQTPITMFHPCTCGYLGGATFVARGQIVHGICEVLFLGSRGGRVVSWGNHDSCHSKMNSQVWNQATWTSPSLISQCTRKMIYPGSAPRCEVKTYSCLSYIGIDMVCFKLQDCDLLDRIATNSTT